VHGQEQSGKAKAWRGTAWQGGAKDEPGATRQRQCTLEQGEAKAWQGKA